MKKEKRMPKRNSLAEGREISGLANKGAEETGDGSVQEVKESTGTKEVDYA